MKTILRNFGVLAVVMAAIAVSAQERARITVPFAFNAAGLSMPSGEYRVAFDAGNKMVTLSGAGKVIVLAATYDFELNDPRTYLRFEHVGDQFLLQQVAIAGEAQQISDKAAKKLIAEKTAVEYSAQAAARRSSVGGAN